MILSIRKSDFCKKLSLILNQKKKYIYIYIYFFFSKALVNTKPEIVPYLKSIDGSIYHFLTVNLISKK